MPRIAEPVWLAMMSSTLERTQLCQKDLVQRILYVLTYFVRCSELQENQLMWSGGPAQGEQILHGSSITTALERGEVEESEYVVVTVRSEPALLPPTLPVTTA